MLEIVGKMLDPILASKDNLNNINNKLLICQTIKSLSKIL
jgi:hypothetical protein